jgi:hypothetical protein
MRKHLAAAFPGEVEDFGEAERHSGMNPNASEHSDAGVSIFHEAFGSVKRNLSEAQRRRGAASRERVQGKGPHVLSPPQRTVARSANSAPHRRINFRMADQPDGIALRGAPLLLREHGRQKP